MSRPTTAPQPGDLLTRDSLPRWIDPPLWGMVHLRPLPGSPGFEGDPDGPIQQALLDVEQLAAAGFAAVVVENYGDTPFFGATVPAVTVAAMSRAVAAIRQRWPQLRVTVNCLRNDANAAVSIAVATGADAVRINVHSGAAVTDQGLLTGRAAETLRLRAALSPAGRGPRILADLRVKHAAPLAQRPVEDEALDLRHRGRADALLITGPGTGRSATTADVAPVRAVLPDVPLLVASGVSLENVGQWAGLVDGAIVGTSIMHDGVAGRGVHPDRARALLQAWARASSG